MAMNDPRMRNLTEEEGLKGLGAYWIIIEKLALLPEPRAQLEYLRPFCSSKKIMTENLPIPSKKMTKTSKKRP